MHQLTVVSSYTLTHNHSSRLSVSFFFFQAEDGIRDGTVTGVQTCALPISVAVGAATAAPTATGRPCPIAPPVNVSRSWKAEPRSEERRVGKGGRCRVEAEEVRRRCRGSGVTGVVRSRIVRTRWQSEVDDVT